MVPQTAFRLGLSCFLACERLQGMIVDSNVVFVVWYFIFLRSVILKLFLRAVGLNINPVCLRRFCFVD